MKQLEIIEEKRNNKNQNHYRGTDERRRLAYVVKCVYRGLRCTRRRPD